MCSTPKAGPVSKGLSSKVETLSDGMSAEEYSAFVQTANESYEKRQQELAILRAQRKTTTPRSQAQAENNSISNLCDRLKSFFLHAES